MDRLKIFFIFGIMFLLSLSFVGATLKSYDENSQTVTLSSNFLFINTGEIATVKLDTPLSNYVPYGIDGKHKKVAQITVSNFKDYNNAFQKIDTYYTNDLKTNINRQFTYEVVSYNNVSFPCLQDNKLLCYKTEEVYTPLADYNFKAGETLTIGIFTDVQLGDKVEWIPTFFGAKISEWATWTTDSQIINGLSGTTNSASANMFNISDNWYLIAGREDGTFNGYNLAANGTTWLHNSTITIGLNDTGTKSSSTYLEMGSNKYLIVGGAPTIYGYVLADNGTAWIYNTTITAGLAAAGTQNYVESFYKDESWYFLTGNFGGDVTGYVWGGNSWTSNSTIVSGLTDFGNFASPDYFVLNETEYLLVGECGAGCGHAAVIYGFTWGGNSWAPSLIANDSITVADSLAVPSTTQKGNYLYTIIGYDGGTFAGWKTYSPFFGPPTIVLDSPADASTHTTSSILFNGTINSETDNLINVSLLLDGSFNDTNASGIEGYSEFSKILSDGVHTWGIYACDENGCKNSTQRTVTIDTTPIITVWSPMNQSYPTSTIFFNATATQPVDTWIVNYNGTNSTLPSINTTLSVEDGYHSLTFYGRNSGSGSWGLNNTIVFTVDTTAPVVVVSAPQESIAYIYEGYNLTLNFTATDSNTEWCTWEYNLTNSSVPCSNATLTTFYFDYEKGKNSGLLYVNDSLNNLNLTNVSWYPHVIDNGRTFNSTSLDTKIENFLVNVTANSSLSRVYLNYNGTRYTATQSGNVWSKQLDILPINLGENLVNFIFEYEGTNTTSLSNYQNVSNLQFVLCNGTYTDQFLNLTFKDETTGDYTNASVPFSNWTYYLGDGTYTKTYEYSTTSDNWNYSFCSNAGSNVLNVLPYIQYKQGTTYPQRNWNPEVQTYTNNTINQTLYLLGTNDGIYVTFQLINAAEETLQGVVTNITKAVDGTEVLFSSGTTGADGGVTYWLNPNSFYTANFFLSGYPFYSTYQQFTQSSYTITLGSSTTANATDYFKGISYSIKPTNKQLTNDTVYSFNFTISSTYFSLEGYGLNITNSSGSSLFAEAFDNTGSGGTVNVNVNTSKNQTIVMNAYWTYNGVNTTVSTYWIVLDLSGNTYSISHLISDFKTYSSSATGIFGLTSFGTGLIIFFVILGVVGALKAGAGVSNGAIVFGVIFSLVALFDVSFGLIPNPVGAISNFPTIFMGIIFLGVIFKEVFT